MRFRINGIDVLEASIHLPRNGAWVISARLDTIGSLAPLAPMTLTADAVPVMAGEVSRSSIFVDRVRVVCQPTGAALLSMPMAPLFIKGQTRAQVAQTIANAAGAKLEYRQSDGGDTLESATMSSKINGWGALRYFCGKSVRCNAMSTILVGDVATPIAADFSLLDDSALAGLVDIAIGGKSFMVQPGDVWRNYRVIGTTYQIARQARATLRVQS